MRCQQAAHTMSLCCLLAAPPPAPRRPALVSSRKGPVRWRSLLPTTLRTLLPRCWTGGAAGKTQTRSRARRPAPVQGVQYFESSPSTGIARSEPSSALATCELRTRSTALNAKNNALFTPLGSTPDPQHDTYSIQAAQRSVNLSPPKLGPPSPGKSLLPRSHRCRMAAAVGEEPEYRKNYDAFYR